MSSDPRQVTYQPLGDLAADPRNPKAHDTETIDRSIGRFGVLDPIVQDQRTGFIVSGHGRHKVLSDMEARGETPPEGVKVASDGAWLVPVVTGWASRTDTEAAAALVALNRTTELGGWVDDSLLDILGELSAVEDGLAGVGFTEDDREALEHLSYTIEEGPRDLDDLYVEVGDPVREDSLTKVVLQLERETAERLSEIVGETPEANEKAALQIIEVLGSD